MHLLMNQVCSHITCHFCIHTRHVSHRMTTLRAFENAFLSQRIFLPEVSVEHNFTLFSSSIDVSARHASCMCLDFCLHLPLNNQQSSLAATLFLLSFPTFSLPPPLARLKSRQPLLQCHRSPFKTLGKFPLLHSHHPIPKVLWFECFES